MQTLASEYKTTADLLAASPKKVASVLLDIANDVTQNGMFWPETVDAIALGDQTLVPASESNPYWQTVGVVVEASPYGLASRPQINLLLAKAWAELERDEAIVHAVGMNGTNGWLMLTEPKPPKPAQPPTPAHKTTGTKP